MNVSFTNVQKTYCTLRGKVEALRGIDLEIGQGESKKIDVEVDYAYSPEGQTVLLTVESNAEGPPPTVFILVKMN